MIASKIDRKLRDHILNSKDNLFSSHGHGQRPSSSPSSSRPVLVIVDRNVDFVPMLAHGWTYLSLVHDALKPHLGVIKMESFIDAQDPSKGKIKRNYDLGANDFFWARNAAIPFPQVAEDIDIELTKYKIDASEVTRKTGVSSIEDLNETGSSASHLKAAITLLPELRERKAILDMHGTSFRLILPLTIMCRAWRDTFQEYLQIMYPLDVSHGSSHIFERQY